MIAQTVNGFGVSSRMSKPVSVAIIGAGIGAQHLDAYLTLPEQFRVVSVCDSDINKAIAIAAPHDIPVSTDLQVILNNDAIDLIDICLPPALHFNAAKSAIGAGKHVICEKPLVTTVREADELCVIVEKSERQLFPVFQYRYGLATRQLDALVKEGLTGAPFVASIETHWNRGADYYSVPWRGTYKVEQGGAVLCHAIHNHDLLCRYFGSVKYVNAMTATRVNPIETEDCVSIGFEMENGALASSSITLGAATDTTRLRYCFERITVESGSTPYAPATDIWQFIARDSRDQIKVDEVTQAVQCNLVGYAGYFSAIADALQSKTGDEVILDDGRRSIELVAAVYQAAYQRSTVTLPLERDSEFYHSLNPLANMTQ